ncbi:MAG: AAA family ATPase [Dysgonamonadaceae bacterium]|jgi:AAA15 family ATPase/GTPase|nr:AAA family ATPase [Dysgonamonadaceae bacterium]
MIIKLKIKNFKSHKNTELNTGNLTVLTGINNSGKSSVLQSLLLLRQSFKKGRLNEGLDLNEPLCEVGFKSAVSKLNEPFWESSQKHKVADKYEYNNKNVVGFFLAESCERDKIVISFIHSILCAVWFCA